MHNFAQVCAVMNVWRATSNFEAYIKTFINKKALKWQTWSRSLPSRAKSRQSNREWQGRAPKNKWTSKLINQSKRERSKKCAEVSTPSWELITRRASTVSRSLWTVQTNAQASSVSERMTFPGRRRTASPTVSISTTGIWHMRIRSTSTWHRIKPTHSQRQRSKSRFLKSSYTNRCCRRMHLRICGPLTEISITLN